MSVKMQMFVKVDTKTFTNRFFVTGKGGTCWLTMEEKLHQGQIEDFFFI